MRPLLRHPILLAALLWSLFPPPALGHQLQVEPVVVVIRPQERFLTAEFTGNIQDITQGVNVTDAETVGDRFTPEAEQRVAAYVNERFVIEQGGQPLRGELTTLRHQSDLDPTRAKFKMVLRYPRPASESASAPFLITTRLFDYLPNAQTILSVAGLQKTLAPGDSLSVDPSAFATNLMRNIRDFAVLGVEHIFTGPDHVLFILALLLVSTSLPSLIKTLTGFTIAHSITLILAALGIFTLPERLIEPLIALSIIYVGAENLFLKNTNHRFWVASAFGLVHGFGFAGILREIGLPEGMAQFWSLLSFNLGVEIGQVIICAIAFPLLMWWKRGVTARAKYGGMDWSSVVRAASLGVVVAGGYWLVQRVIG